MALAPGTRLGAYEILTLLGAGGMGEVYKARDTRLDRIVAIKVLPSSLASDQQFRDRFDREARTISQLDHAHICALYDVGEQDGTAYLVMQYLEGETLEARLKKGALPLDEALEYAIQIIDALDKAHHAGIVHRDLKPGNIMLTKSGATLLDFGLAKTGASIAAGAGLSMLPTTPPDLTAQGTILGTFQYMAPEQLEGKEADARTDVFAFGALVFEMLTGKKAFEGKTQASVIGAILKDTPAPISMFQPLAPPLLDHIVIRCLAKEPDDRWQVAADLTGELKWMSQAGARMNEAASATAAAPGTRERLVWTTAATVATAAAIGLSVVLFLRPRSEPAPVIRFEVSPPVGTTLRPGLANPHQAVSPDGRRLAFVVVNSVGVGMLAVRSFDAVEAQVLPGTEGVAVEAEGVLQGLPFWSPDSRFIGFFANGKLKKIDLNGGLPQVLCGAPNPEGGAWSSESQILFAPMRTGGLFTVSTAGGTPTAATTLDANNKETSHRWPWFLPDSRHFLYIAGPPTTIYVGSLDSQARTKLFESDSKALYSAGYLLFVRQGTLLAQSFDATHVKVVGDPFPLAERVGFNSANARAAFSASATGVLTYRTDVSRASTRLVWLDRNGHQISVLAALGNYGDIELSPDGRQLAVSDLTPQRTKRDLLLFDVGRNLSTRLTFGPETAYGARWSPTGDSVVFRTVLAGKARLTLKTSGGPGTEAVLLESTRGEYPDSWSPDGRFILYELEDPKTSWDLWVLSVATRQVRPFLQMEFRQEFARFSPDGRWVAYRSTESGQGADIFVVPFPGPGGKWRISAGGGTYPRWRRDGKELFFLAPDNKLMTAAVDTSGQAFHVGAVRSLFEVHVRLNANYPYDVSSDGQRFLVSTYDEQVAAAPMTVVLNWTAALKK